MPELKEYKSLKRCKDCGWEGFSLSYYHRSHMSDGRYCWGQLKTIPPGEVTDVKAMVSVARGRVGHYERQIERAERTVKNAQWELDNFIRKHEYVKACRDRAQKRVDELSQQLVGIRAEEDQKREKREAREQKREERERKLVEREQKRLAKAQPQVEVNTL